MVSENLLNPQYISEDIFLAQKKLIIELLGDDLYHKLLKRGQNHPAIKACRICDRMINQGGIIRWPEDERFIGDILSVALDSYCIVKSSGGNINKFTLGDFANYGDPLVRERLLTRLENPTNFLSLMTEFSCGALYYNNSNCNVAALDDNKEVPCPDFEVLTYSPPSTIVFECKRFLSERLSKNTLQTDIKDANRKIKSLSTNKYGHQICGVLVLDISNLVGDPKVSLTQHQNTLPPKVIETQLIIKNLIRQHNSSVSGILIVWNEYQTFNNNGKTLFTFHKRGIFVPHLAPKLHILPGIIKPDWGYTLYIPVNWKERYSSYQ